MAASREFIVTLTFDLEDAGSSAYEKMTVGLAGIGLQKNLMDGNRVIGLPENTYVGKMSGESTVAVRNYFCRRIETIYNTLNLSGPFFVSVGDDWAIGKRYVDQPELLRMLSR